MRDLTDVNTLHPTGKIKAVVLINCSNCILVTLHEHVKVKSVTVNPIQSHFHTVLCQHQLKP